MNTRHTKESLIAFEQRMISLWESGDLPSLVHFSGGNEDHLLSIFRGIGDSDWVFCSHRAHYHCLLKGMPEEVLEANIRADRSMFCYDAERRIYQSAILGGCCGIAVGVAKAIKEAGEKEHVYYFIGDGASDNGSLYEAALYVTGHDLPCTFIIENNNMQVDTPLEVRRGEHHWRFKLTAPCVQEYHYQPRWPHAGSGTSKMIEFKRKTPLT